MTKMKIKPNKRNKQKKTYREIVIEKQANTGKIDIKKKKKTKGKTRKANYEDNNSREEADRVLAGNRHGRWH
jgi:hypothetical protein